MLQPFDYAILLLFAFWLGMLIDCLCNKSLGRWDKLIWTLVILLGVFLGAIVYTLMVFPRHFFKSEAVNTSPKDISPYDS